MSSVCVMFCAIMSLLHDKIHSTACFEKNISVSKMFQLTSGIFLNF